MSDWLDKHICIWWTHDWTRITFWKPIERDKKSNTIGAIPMAVYECERCGDIAVAKVYGDLSWWGSEVIDAVRALGEWTETIMQEMDIYP